MEKNTINVAFIGNPNCGKTTLFNAYTGAKLKVANWPGVTVEKKEGAFRFHNQNYKLVDLPGIYSLTSYTMEEKLSREYILGDDVDVIIDVVDASSLERNLYLALQLIELGKPVVLALNMMDIVEERGMDIDLHRLPEMLGVPVIPVSARKRRGLDILMHAAAHHSRERKSDYELQHHHGNAKSHHRHNHHRDCAVVYDDAIEDKIDLLTEKLTEKYGALENPRWLSLKLLANDAAIMAEYPLDDVAIIDKSYEKSIIKEKYDFIGEIMAEVLVHKDSKAAMTDRADKILTHRIFGIPIFLGIMAVIFFLTFTLGDMLKDVLTEWIDNLCFMLTGIFNDLAVNEAVASLVIDGAVAGVGSILTFLPNIFILFVALAILEDSGYMSRVAFVMDGIMGRVGLSGRAFIPMLLGFGCSVPAIMASRALEDERDRLKTIILTPFMSCSARLPIYILFSEIFFGDYAMLAAYSMYVIGIAVAIVIAKIMSATAKGAAENPLLIELPEYKSPNTRSIMIYSWEKVKGYIERAGTMIFAASLLVWFILNFNMDGRAADVSMSFGAQLGKFAVPFLEPLGLGSWQLAVALFSGLAAKEVVVASLSVLFGIVNVNSALGMRDMADVLGAQGFGILNAYAMMVFCLLYTPCVATLGVIRKETGSVKMMAGVMLFQLAVAWCVTFLVYNIGRIFF
jgi:ferrous iron transport protein B